MNRVYLAGPFSWQAKILAHARELEDLGYTSTGKWLTQEAGFTRPDNTTDTQKVGLHQHCHELTVRDIQDILASDTLILFEPGIPLERNTRVAEFGLALGTGRRCIVIKPSGEFKDVISNIFVKLNTVPEEWASDSELERIKPVMEFSSWEEFLVVARSWALK